MQHQTVTVQGFFEGNTASLGLQLVAGGHGLRRIIREPTVNRPGLALAGFTRYFASKRIQVLGSAETTFLRSLPAGERRRRYARLFAYKIPCFVFSRNLNPDREFLEAAEKAGVPVFRSPLITMRFINLATLALEMMFAPWSIEMGSMVDILGVGVIIRGESGIGKSECVLALIERGYCLVSDDATRVTLIENREVVGSSKEITRNHMEVRGIGIIDVAAMFGVRSIRSHKRVDLVVTLKSWEHVKDIDRLGMEDHLVKILGVDMPHFVIPVRPGRDLARLVEVAAFQTKLRSSGHNAAQELNKRLISQMTGQNLG
ncbi:MAG: HPr(Ser) kinase/phosphatase [Verrucomicrobia bacterium]|nr:HPr(Ser) kinase/phosphatase [Verrucomicrobiota bacterium]